MALRKNHVVRRELARRFSKAIETVRVLAVRIGKRSDNGICAAVAASGLIRFVLDRVIATLMAMPLVVGGFFLVDRPSKSDLPAGWTQVCSHCSIQLGALSRTTEGFYDTASLRSQKASQHEPVYQK